MRKYIPQRTFNDFVYPNNNKAQYDVNDVVQNINPNVVSGTVTNFVATLVGGSLKVDFNYTWSKNGAEVFVNQSNEINTISLHVMPAGVTYFKPWRCVDNLTAVSGSTSASGAYSETFSASLLGVPSLTGGTYYFEIRMIGLLQNYIIAQQYTVAAGSTPTPTPTRTLTPTPSVSSSPGASASPTPTMTPSPSGSPGASSSPTPTPTMTMTPTPSVTGPFVYRTITLSNPPGNNSTAGACAVTTGLSYYIGYTSAISSGLVIYTNTSLTTRLYNSDPLADGFYVMLYDNDNSLRYAVDFDASGDVNTVTSC